MPPFQYSTPSNPFVGTIGQMIEQRGAIEAARAVAVANAQARAAEASGAAWGGAVRDIGHTVGSTITQLADPRRKLDQMAVDRATQMQTGERVLDQAMQPGAAPQGPAEGGGTLPTPTRSPYLGEDGLYDIPKLTQVLAASGVAHLSPELLKGAEAINDSILKHQDLQLKTAQAETVLYGDMADGALKLVKAGVPIERALDVAAAPGLATQRFDQRRFMQLKDRLLAMSPADQQAALGSLMDAAAKISPEKDLAKDAKRLDRYNRETASNLVPEKPTEVSLAADAANADSPTRAQSQAALDKLRDQKNPPSLEEQYLKAVADGKKESAQMILDTWKAKAAASRDPVATAQLEAIRSLTQQEAQARLEDRDVSSPKNQQKFEQEYRTVLQRGLSSRSGGLGLEDAKVQQANHLLALMDQNLDPKTGDYNIPKVQYEELALGLARLVSPGGTVGEGMKNDLVQATAAGDLKKVATYLTGTPFNGSTQDVFKMLRDSIQRQGSVAMDNREGEMRYLRGLAPTDLAESRRQALEATSLNPLRQSRVIENTKTGERKLQVSIDGGKTWQ
jgi:hypothetical protein